MGLYALLQTRLRRLFSRLLASLSDRLRSGTAASLALIPLRSAGVLLGPLAGFVLEFRGLLEQHGGNLRVLWVLRLRGREEALQHDQGGLDG
jgi:hypothetical protein